MSDNFIKKVLGKSYGDRTILGRKRRSREALERQYWAKTKTKRRAAAKVAKASRKANRH